MDVPRSNHNRSIRSPSSRDRFYMSKMEAAGERLPDDVVLEILLRVPGADVAATLFRCALTCKRWRALGADRSFLRRQWPEGACTPSSLLGFFVLCKDDNSDVSLQPVFLPPPSGSSVLGSRPRPLASFFPGLQHGDLDGAVPLAARHGLLLVRLARPANNDPARLAVCDVLAGTCVVLPSLKRGVFSVSCAIITGADCCSSNRDHQRPPLSPDYYSTFFKVLAIVMDDSRNDHSEWNNLYTFSSAEPGWSEPANCFNTLGRPGEATLQWRNKVVVCRGMAHWLGSSMSKYYILGVSTKTGHISLWGLSFSKELLSTTMYGEPTLIVTAACSPALFWLREGGLSLDMSMQEDDDGICGRWLHARTVKLKPPRAWNPSSVQVWSGEKSGVLLIIDTFKSVHMIDIESGAMEDVSEQFRSSWGMMAVPVEIDWPTLFMSRLGGG